MPWSDLSLSQSFEPRVGCRKASCGLTHQAANTTQLCVQVQELTGWDKDSLRRKKIKKKMKEKEKETNKSNNNKKDK